MITRLETVGWTGNGKLQRVLRCSRFWKRLGNKFKEIDLQMKPSDSVLGLPAGAKFSERGRARRIPDTGSNPT